MPSFNKQPPAYMGFVGFVKILGGNIEGTGTSHGDYIVRATTADINLSQEVTKPNVVDGRFDKTVYQLGPKLVDGTLEFPALNEVPIGETLTLFEILYRYAVTRNTTSGLLSSFDMEVKYASSASLPHNESEFKYTGCIVNTWKFTVAQQDSVNCSIGIIGVDRETSTGLVTPPRSQDCSNPPAASGEAGGIGTTRVVTWNDARVEIAGPRLPDVIGGQYIRSFEANVNNDVERFYTLNTQLVPQAIAPRKRDITGNVVLMGRHPVLSQAALTNEGNCSEDSVIKFGFVTSNIGTGCSGSSFGVTLTNCVFEIEEMSLSNDLFETTVNWHSLPSSGTGVCDPLVDTLGNTNFLYSNDLGI